MADYFYPFNILAGRPEDTDPPVVEFSRGDGDTVVLFDDSLDSSIVFKRKLHGPTGLTVSAVKVQGDMSCAGAQTGVKGVVLGIRFQKVTGDNTESWTTGGWSTQTKDMVPFPSGVAADVTATFDIDAGTDDDGLEVNDVVWVEVTRLGTDTTTETSGDDVVGDLQLEGVGLKVTAA